MIKLDPTRYEAIRFEQDGSILTVTLNRPDSLNAVNEQLHDELACVFYDIAMDDSVDVVVLTGAGRAFCAGGDMAWLDGMRADPKGFERTATRGKRIVFSLLDLEKPVIAKVNGAAIGLGATLALLSDVVFMADDAKIGDPHVLVGVVAGDGGAMLWPQLIGYARAKEYLFTGDTIEAKRAAEMGLVNHAVPRAELDARSTEFAQRLAHGPINAIRYTKTVTNIPLRQIAHATMDAALAYEMATSRSEDHAEALAAFQARRTPVFKGR